jgi:hypothetical protein
MLFFTIACFSGCVYIPTPKHGLRSDLKINSEQIEKLVDGETTLQEVIIELGEPTFVIKEKKTLAFLWQEREGYIVGMGLSGYYPLLLPTPAYEENHEFIAVLLKFDDDYILFRHEKKNFDPQSYGDHLTVEITNFVTAWADEDLAFK